MCSGGRRACVALAPPTAAASPTSSTAWGQASWSVDSSLGPLHWATFSSPCAIRKDFLRFVAYLFLICSQSTRAVWRYDVHTLRISTGMTNPSLILIFYKFKVEVIRARGLQARQGSRTLPAPYVKVYLVSGKRCISKAKTTTARRTLDPLYQQTLTFRENFKGCVLQVSMSFGWVPTSPNKYLEIELDLPEIR